MEGFSFEVQIPNLASNSFCYLQESFKEHSHASKLLEIRHPSFIVDTPFPHRLESGLARVFPNGEWKLTDGVNLLLGTNRVRASNAMLDVTGRNAGNLIMEGQTFSINFFSTNETLPQTISGNRL